MKKEITLGNKSITIEENALDRAIRYISPTWADKRFRSRAFTALSGAYIGARTDRRQTLAWSTSRGDADADTLTDLPTLRSRSRDLMRNEPLACGAINTVVTNVVGTGLKLQSRIDRAALNMSDEEAAAWEANAEREFSLWAESADCDAARTLTFVEHQELAFRQSLENGDHFVVLPRIPLRGAPYTLRIQHVEADRVTNAGGIPDTTALVAGIQRDDTGAPVSYHICDQHPGGRTPLSKRTWKEIPAFGNRTNLRNVIHLYKMLRAGQTRGVPYLAPVIESLKQIGKYTEAELMAAVVTSMLTVFIKTESGDLDLQMTPAGETGATGTDEDLKLASGAIIGLAPGESIETVNPLRPNAGFDPFIIAILRQIGVALELPFEILVKHFTSSYSASRAALLEAWRFFNCRRQWIAAKFCQPIYEVWLFEAVSIGRISAPGFFSDPIIRRAYCGSEWIGPARGMIDETKEVKAAQDRVNMGISTLQEETAQITGGDWLAKFPQIVKERKMMRSAGFLLDGIWAKQQPEPDEDEESATEAQQ